MGVPSSVGDSKSVAILSKPGKPELAQVVPELLDWLNNRKYRAVIDTETAEYTKAGPEIVERAAIVAYAPAFVIVLGGDGTLLSAARAVAKAEIPLPDLYPTLEAVIEGRCSVEARSLVHCELVRGGKCIGRYDALNDVIV